MVSLEQIHALEARVEKAVLLIEKLRKENAELEQRLVEASRSEESLREAYSKLESNSAGSLESAKLSESRLLELQAALAEAEEKHIAAELRASEIESKVAAETAACRERALIAEQKASELETKAEQLRHEQSRIEEGLTHALEKLDAFEDLVMGISLSETASPIDQLPGDEKVEAAEQSPSAPAPQEEPFRDSGFAGSPGQADSSGAGTVSDSAGADGKRDGFEHEFDIF